MKKFAMTIFAGIAAILAARAHTFEIGNDAFLLDGEKFQIRCGEVHFARIPRHYWRHRLQMCKAMGLNTVCAYLFWNYHEMERGQFNFKKSRDVAEFCRIAQEEGLWVIVRPGPYSCAEWEFGGLPWWLLDKGAENVRVRTRDAAYLEPAKAYIRRVAEELKDLQITHGGPILMVQDENEYGFFGDDGEYIRELYSAMREAGFDVPIFTCNPAYHLKKGAIPETFKVVNFGANPENGFKRLREVLPEGPLMCGEYYPAWFDSWGQRHHTKPAQKMLRDLDWMLANGGSFSLYMAHGGTSFGEWAGCNSPFAPQTSSYDYEAPISEQGRATPKFYALRELFKKYMTPDEAAALPEIPAPLPVAAASFSQRCEIAPLALSSAKLNKEPAKEPVAMEILGQGYGAVVYQTVLGAGQGGLLRAPNLRDQAAVFANGECLGFLDRRYPKRSVEIPCAEAPRSIAIVVQHMSRYNFGEAMNHAAKGLLPPVTLDGAPLEGWNAFGAPLDRKYLKRLAWSAPKPDSGDTPCTFKRYRVQFETLADTFLDVRGWKKGEVFVNGHNIGRFWGIGPTQTMFVPGCWLREGLNDIIIWDFAGNVPLDGIKFGAEPVLDELHRSCDIIPPPERENEPLPLDTLQPVAEGEFPDQIAAETVEFKPVKARRIAFQMLDAWGKDARIAAVGELELLDEAHKSISHDNWRFIHVSSEETQREDGAAENAIDGQISNFWHSRWSEDKAAAPHVLAIDLGKEISFAALRYTPRQVGENGRIRRFRFFAW